MVAGLRFMPGCHYFCRELSDRSFNFAVRLEHLYLKYRTSSFFEQLLLGVRCRDMSLLRRYEYENPCLTLDLLGVRSDSIPASITVD